MNDNTESELKHFVTSFLKSNLAKSNQAFTIVYLGSNRSEERLKKVFSLVVLDEHSLSLPGLIERLRRIRSILVDDGYLIGRFKPKPPQSFLSPKISKTELLGSLIHSGYQILEERETPNFHWFISQKTDNLGDENDIIDAQNVFFKQPRIGKGGRLIRVYKLRTMYPLSHLIQDYVFKQSRFGQMGKVEDDFRVTPLGRWLRRYWIDELPQLLNVLKGEMSLVGLRPLSEGFFKKLPDDVRSERIKYLPGLIPAVYAENPKNLEERIAAERKYLRLKKRSAFFTDLSYFLRVLRAIVLYGQRGN